MNQITDAIRTSKQTALINAALSLMQHMGTAGAAIEVPDTTPPVYILIGDTAAIGKLLPEATKPRVSEQSDERTLPPLPAQPEELRARWKCEDCGGTGEVGELIDQGYFQPPERARCSTCDGAGQVEVAALLPEQAIEYARAAITQQAAPEAPTGTPVEVPGHKLVVFDELTEEGAAPRQFVINDERAATFHTEHFLKNHLEPIYRITPPVAAPEAQASEPQGGATACWSCKQPYTLEQRADADGNCLHCGVEIELDASPAATTASASGEVCATCGGSKVDPGGLPICRDCGRTPALSREAAPLEATAQNAELVLRRLEQLHQDSIPGGWRELIEEAMPCALAVWRAALAQQSAASVSPVARQPQAASTDLSKHLREAADAVMLQETRQKLMLAAADEIERYCGGMLAWKRTAEAKDREFAATQADPTLGSVPQRSPEDRLTTLTRNDGTPSGVFIHARVSPTTAAAQEGEQGSAHSAPNEAVELVRIRTIIEVSAAFDSSSMQMITENDACRRILALRSTSTPADEGAPS